jgi:hypothetical protein
MKIILTTILILLNFNLFSQTDIKLTISESTINKIFDAIGTIYGEGEYKIIQNRKFNWTLNSTHIDLIQDSAIFKTNAEVKTHLGTYQDQIIGKVSVIYNEKKNSISIQVIDALFEVAINIGKKRIVLKKIQLADYFKTPFQFEGPGKMSEDILFEMPNGEVKKISVNSQNFKMKIINNNIIVTSDLLMQAK